jgi:hypothetical protein
MSEGVVSPRHRRADPPGALPPDPRVIFGKKRDRRFVHIGVSQVQAFLRGAIAEASFTGERFACGALSVIV